jgi:hypothetical protein
MYAYLIGDRQIERHYMCSMAFRSRAYIHPSIRTYVHTDTCIHTGAANVFLLCVHVVHIQTYTYHTRNLGILGYLPCVAPTQFCKTSLLLSEERLQRWSNTEECQMRHNHPSYLQGKSQACARETLCNTSSCVLTLEALYGCRHAPICAHVLPESTVQCTLSITVAPTTSILTQARWQSSLARSLAPKHSRGKRASNLLAWHLPSLQEALV